MRKLLTLTVWMALIPVAAAQMPVQHTPDWTGLAEMIVQRLDPQPGEKILILSQPGQFEPLISPLRYALLERGAVDLGNLDVLPQPFPENWSLELLQRTFSANRESLHAMFSGVDGVIKLPGAQTGVAYLAAQDLLREGRGRTVHFHWEGAYPLHGEPLPAQPAIDAVYQRAVLDTDYGALADAQRRFEAAMRDATVRVTTPAGTDLRFRIGDRPVTRQDGDASARRAASARNLIDREVELPAGAIRVAPQEDSVEGVVVIPQSIWDGYPVRELRLEFEAGRLIRYTAESGEAHVAAELERGETAARAFREFALGFNPLLAVPERNAWVPYYGYGAGVVRLSLGDNTELGGQVSGPYVRWNFFTDATVTTGDQTWVLDGRLLSPPE